MKTQIFSALLIVTILTSCTGTQVAPAYQAALPACHGGDVRVCANFGDARDARQCACVDDALVFVD